MLDWKLVYILLIIENNGDASPESPYRPLDLSSLELFLRVIKRPRPKAEQRPPWMAKVKNEWSCAYTPRTRFYGMYGDNCTSAI